MSEEEELFSKMLAENEEVLLQLVNDRLVLGYSAYSTKDGKIIRETDRITSGELVVKYKDNKS